VSWDGFSDSGCSGNGASLVLLSVEKRAICRLEDRFESLADRDFVGGGGRGWFGGALGRGRTVPGW
jgi:hypothetical protein